MALCARNPNPPIMLDDSFKFSWSYTLYFDQFKQKFGRYGISSLDFWLWKGRQTPLAYVFLGAHGQYIYFIKREFEVLSFTFKKTLTFDNMGLGLLGQYWTPKRPANVSMTKQKKEKRKERVNGLYTLQENVLSYCEKNFENIF